MHTLVLICLHALGSARADAPDTMGAGCAEAGATGWYEVEYNGTRQPVLVIEDDCDEGAGADACDGLPTAVWCPGTTYTTPVTINPSGGTDSCGGLQTVSATGTHCAFDILVWVGDNDDNDDSGGDIDCSSATRPVMMFGGFGIDRLKGSDHGDLLHGGGGGDFLTGGEGPDVICGGPNRDNEADPKKYTTTGQLPIEDECLHGGDHDDFIWGGPDADSSYGDEGNDLVAGGGDLVGDHVQGDAGDDTVNPEAGGDYLDGDSELALGGAGADVMFAGRGHHYMYGGTGVDVIFAQDIHDDAEIDGDTDGATCYVDDGSSDDDDLITDCTTVGLAPCTPAFYVGAHDGTNAQFYELNADGSQIESPAKLDAGSDDYADEVIGIAIDPYTCLVWVVLDYAGEQTIHSFDPATEPGADGDYDVGAGKTVAGDDLVDIAFTAHGNPSFMIGLEDDADLVRITKESNDTETHLTTIGRPGSTGKHLAFDAPDAGQIVAMTDPGSGDFSVDMYDGYTDWSRTLEHSIDWSDGGMLPFTFVVLPNSAGFIVEIDDDYSKGNGYPIYLRTRRNWSGVLDTGAVDDARLALVIPGGGGCNPCYADLDDPPDALAAPHWAE